LSLLKHYSLYVPCAALNVLGDDVLIITFKATKRSEENAWHRLLMNCTVGGMKRRRRLLHWLPCVDLRTCHGDLPSTHRQHNYSDTNEFHCHWWPFRS